MFALPMNSSVAIFAGFSAEPAVIVPRDSLLNKKERNVSHVRSSKTFLNKVFRFVIR